MFKKVALILFLVCLAFSLFAQSGNIKLRSMSLTGLADSTNDANFFVNPASLYLYDQSTKFALSSGLIANPDVYLTTEFINKRISLMIDVTLRNTLENIMRDVSLEFNAAVGYKNFGCGIGFYGGSTMYQKKTKNAVAYALFGKYKRVEDSEYLNMKVGTIYKLNNFSFGITVDQIFTNAIENTSFGVYWAQQKYAKRGRLNHWVFNAGAEVTDIFSSDRALNAGLDATLQLNEDYSISFRTGTSVSLLSDGPMTVSGGVGTHLGALVVGANVLLPVMNGSGPASFEISLSIIN